MTQTQIIAIILGVVAFAAAGALVVLIRGSNAATIKGLMPSGQSEDILPSARRRRVSQDDDEELDFEDLKVKAGKSVVKERKETLRERLFRAGFYLESDLQKFRMWQIACPLIIGPLLGTLSFLFVNKPAFGVVLTVLGMVVGYRIPGSFWLDRKIRERQEETLYYLPLVVEQISIGVSSSLDIGPCISTVVQMATERDMHNPVTEMFLHVEKLIRSGLNLEEALIDVGEASGQTEVKHAFLFLAQCAKHGGELSKQLQELADSVMMQRQMFVEGRIAALPVKATGPLAMVFAGFFGLLFSGLLIRLMEAFGGAASGG